MAGHGNAPERSRRRALEACSGRVRDARELDDVVARGLLFGARLLEHFGGGVHAAAAAGTAARSEEHTSELQSLMRISYAVFCLKTKTIPYMIQPRNKKQTRQK